MLNNEILTVKDIQEYLKIGRCQAYELIKQEQFPVMKIGRTIRINREIFFLWVNNPEHFKK